MALLVLLLPDIRSLKLFVNEVPSFWINIWTSRIEDSPNDFIQSTLGVIASRLASIQELSLIIEDPKKHFDHRALDFLLTLPFVKTAYFRSTTAGAGMCDEESSPLRAYCTKSPIANLTIDDFIIDNETLIDILKFVEVLETFSFGYGGLSNHLSTTDAVEICQTLLPHRASLKELDIKGITISERKIRVQLAP